MNWPGRWIKEKMDRSYESVENEHFSKKLAWNMCQRNGDHKRNVEWYNRSGIITCPCGHVATYIQ